MSTAPNSNAQGVPPIVTLNCLDYDCNAWFWTVQHGLAQNCFRLVLVSLITIDLEKPVREADHCKERNRFCEHLVSDVHMQTHCLFFSKTSCPRVLIHKFQPALQHPCGKERFVFELAFARCICWERPYLQGVRRPREAEVQKTSFCSFQKWYVYSDHWSNPSVFVTKHK